MFQSVWDFVAILVSAGVTVFLHGEVGIWLLVLYGIYINARLFAKYRGR